MRHFRQGIRGAGWPSAVAMLLASAAAGLVMLGVVLSARADDGAPSSEVRDSPWSIALAARTLGVAGAIGLLATGLALPAGWSMRRLGRAWSLVLLVPMLLPSYLVYAAWGLARAPGTWLGDALEGGPAWRWVAIGHAQAIVGLALWSWPLAALVVGAAARGVDASVLESLRLSGAGAVRRTTVVLSLLRGPIAGAIGVVTLVMLGSAVPLHVANIDTATLVIWRGLNEGAPAAWVWSSASPMVLVAALAGWWIGGRLTRDGDVSAMEEGASGRTAVGRGWLVAAGVLWCASTLGPLGLLAAKSPGWGAVRGVWSAMGPSLASSAWIAAAVGATGVVLAATVSAGLSGSGSSGSRRMAALALRLWLVLALVPGLLTGSAVAGAARAPWLAFLTDSSAGLVAAHVARFGAVAALAGWWAARLEPRSLADARRIYAGDGLASWVRTTGVRQVGLIVGSGLALGLLSLHEIEAAVVLAPPGDGVLARRMLALLHYLRDDELSAAAATLGGFGLVAGVGAAMLAGLSAGALRCMSRLAPLLAVAIMVCGCGRDESPTNAARPVLDARAIGGVGRGDGLFVVPRCMDADERGLWVIDKSGRMQRLTHEGVHRGDFALPSALKGYPTGLSAGPDGNVYIADTHEHRVLIVNSEDSPKMVGEFGTYGHGAGQFVYPTDIAFVRDAEGAIERIFVAEYGGNDRVSAFDARRSFMFSFGRPGNAADAGEHEVVFARPQSVAVWAGRREVVVADAGNHRLGRFTLDGELLKWLGKPGGSPGTGPGEYSYPYGLAVLDDGTALVSEHGSSRVQRVDLETGRGLAIVGGPGRETGRFVTPWGVAVTGGRVFVLDTGNHRVQSFGLDVLGGAR